MSKQANNSVKSFAAAPVQHQKLIKTHSCVGRSINLWHDQNLGVLVLLRQLGAEQNRTWKWRRRRGEEERRKKKEDCAVLVSSPTTQEANHLFALLCFAFPPSKAN
jgi:hypothetical protein